MELSIGIYPSIERVVIFTRGIGAAVIVKTFIRIQAWAFSHGVPLEAALMAGFV